MVLNHITFIVIDTVISCYYFDQFLESYFEISNRINIYSLYKSEKNRDTRDPVTVTSQFLTAYTISIEWTLIKLIIKTCDFKKHVSLIVSRWL